MPIPPRVVLMPIPPRVVIDADTTTGGIDADTTTGGIDADTTTGGIDDQRLRAKNTSEYFCIESTRPTTTTKGGIVRKIND